MPTVIPDTTRIVARAITGTEEMINVFHVVDSTSGVPATQADLRAAFVTFYTGLTGDPAGSRGLGSHLSLRWTLDYVSSQRITSEPFPDPVQTAVGFAGTNAGDPLPWNVALCVQLRTGFSSRRARGRTFLGGFTEADNDDVDLTQPRPLATFLGHVENAFIDLDDNINAAGGALAVASEVDGVSRAVQSVRIQNRWSTQRRRLASVPASLTTTVSFLEA